MATREELFQALRNADAAGDVDGARKLATYIQSLPADAAPAAAVPKPQQASLTASDILRLATPDMGKSAQGLLRGFNRVVDTVGNAVTPDLPQYRQQREQFDAFNSGLDARNEGSVPYQAGDLLGQVGTTLPVGGLVAAPVRALGMTRLGNALATGGMSTGAPATGNMLARAGDMGIRAAGGAGTGAVSAALIDPQMAGSGAAVGAALPPAMKLAGVAGRGVGNMLRPNINNPELARKAIQEYGIPLGPADISQSRMTRAARSLLNDAPFTGGIGERQGEAVQRGFNRAVGKTFGAEADALTPEVLDVAKKKMGGEFDRIWNKNTLQFDAGLFQQMQALRANAAKLPQGEAARLTSWLDDIEGKMVAGPNGELFMPGDVANRFQSKVREQAEKATGFLKDDLQTLRRGILDAFKRNVSPDDAAALASNMKQYKAFKTVEPLLNSAEAGVAGRTPGNVPAGLLPNVVRQSYKGGISDSPFADLSQIGSQYIADRVARTGGGPRALIQNSAIGTLLGLGGYANPLLGAAAIPGAMAVQKGLGSPTVANALLRDRQSQSALVNLLANPELQQAILRAAPAIAADR